MNLWCDMENRTRNVLDYVNGLYQDDSWELDVMRKFAKIKERALETNLSNDERLTIIGYVPNKRPQIFDWMETE